MDYLKIDKIEYKSVIKFFVLEGLTPTEIQSKFSKVYMKTGPSFSTIENGLLFLNQVVQASKMMHAKVAQKSLQHQKSFTKSMT